MIYTVTFNPSVDYALRTDSITKGSVNRTSAENVFWGGKGINVSTILKMLDTDSTALGFVAGFTGKALESALSENGIKTDFITLEKGMTRICVKLFEESTLEETEINPGGPDIDENSLSDIRRKIMSLKSGDILVLAGSVPRSVPNDIYETICSDTQDMGIKVIADASGSLLTKLLPYHPFLVKPNHIEAGEICGITADTPEKAEACALRLRVMGAQNVIVSMADKGAVLAADDGNVYHIGTPKGTVVNSVGAGDSMLAGFIAAYEKYGDYQKALQWGTAAGSATAFSQGLADREKFDKLLGEITA